MAGHLAFKALQFPGKELLILWLKMVAVAVNKGQKIMCMGPWGLWACLEDQQSVLVVSRLTEQSCCWLLSAGQNALGQLGGGD